MSISAVSENAILSLIFCATSWARYADDAAVGAEVSIAVSLNNAELDDVASMATHEVSYSGYARVDRLRNASAWTLVDNGVISPSSKILFPAVSGISGETATHFSTGATGGGNADVCSLARSRPQSPFASSPITPQGDATHNPALKWLAQQPLQRAVRRPRLRPVSRKQTPRAACPPRS